MVAALAMLLIVVVNAKLVVYDPDKNVSVEINGTGVIFSDGRVVSGMFIGTSTDTKPTTVPKGTQFMETDTGKVYWWTGVDWQEVVGAGRGVVTATIIVASNTTPNPDGADFVADGVDDQVEINQAIQKCSGTEYCEVVLLNGTFYISNSINITKDKVILRGSGAKIYYNGAFPAVFVSSKYVSIKDLSIEGGFTATTYGAMGIYFNETADKFTVQNCHIFNTGDDAIYGSYTGTGLITGNYIENSRGPYGGIHPHGVHKWVITNNYVEGSTTGECIRHGYIIANNFCYNNEKGIVGGDNGGVIAGNYISTTDRYYAIWVWSNDTIVANNYIDTFGSTWVDSHAIRIKTLTGTPIGHVIVIGNVIKNVLKEGIYAENAHKFIVADNVIENPSQDSSGGYDAVVLYNSTYAKIKDNTLIVSSTTIPRDFFNETGSSDYNIYMYNTLYGSIAGNKYSINIHSYADQMEYTSLPTDGFVISGVPVWYNDGTSEYLAIWNGTGWKKVALS